MPFGSISLTEKNASSLFFKKNNGSPWIFIKFSFFYKGKSNETTHQKDFSIKKNSLGQFSRGRCAADNDY